MALAVFLVEDSAVIRDNLIETLEELVQASVIAVADSEDDARAWLRANNAWQLAVVDIFISQGSGLGVVRALQQRLPGQRVVVLSNYATDSMRAQCALLDADAVFDKSTELEAFFEFCVQQGSD